VKSIAPRLGDVVYVSASGPTELTGVSGAYHGGFLNLILAQKQTDRASHWKTSVTFSGVHPVNRVEVGIARHPKNRKIAEVARPIHIGVGYHPRGGLCDICKIVSGIRDLRNLLLVNGRRDITILCVDERRFVGHSHFASCLRNCERDVHCNRRPEQDIHYPALFSKAVARHRQRVSSGRKK